MIKDKVKASWDIKSTKVFIDLCLEHIQKGTRECTSFSKNGWKDISKGFTAKTGRAYDMGQLKNKYDALRKDWQLWDRLLHETGVRCDNDKSTIVADDDWWEKKTTEVPGYDKFRNKGLQFQEELTQLFSSVAAIGTHNWAPSSMLLPTEAIPEYDMQEGFGDSDEVLGSTTGLSGELNSFNFMNNSGGSGGNNDKGKGTCGGEKANSSDRTTSSLGVRKRDATMKKKGSALAKIAEALSRMADANDLDVEAARTDRIAAKARANRIAVEAHAERMAAEAHAYEISIAGVMSHLNQVPEVVCDNDFYVRCIHLLMRHPPAREMYVAVKDMRDKLLVFLRHECYGNK